MSQKKKEGVGLEGSELLRRRLREAFISIRPVLLHRVSFALLGIDPQRPLVDSLIEN